jgi:hypothetical protein
MMSEMFSGDVAWFAQCKALCFPSRQSTCGLIYYRLCVLVRAITSLLAALKIFVRPR